MFRTKSNREINYYGRGNTREIKRISDENNNINSIDELFGNLLEVWCKETAYPRSQEDYIYEEDPTYGQCAITAMLVYDMFGGTIHKVKTEDGGTHYFNRINGNYIDLTRDQFDLYDIPVEYEPNKEISREYLNENANTLRRYNLLIELLNKKSK